MKWKSILPLLIVSVLVAGTVVMAAGSMPARGDEDKQLVHTVELGVHLDMDTAIMDVVEDDDLDLYMHSVDGFIWMQGPPIWHEQLSTWDVHGSYNNFFFNPAREGNGTDAMEDAIDDGWIEDDDPDNVQYLANDLDGRWTVNPFAHNDFRFAFQYLDRESIIEDMLDGLGTPRYGWMDARLPAWQEHFVEAIEEPYDLTPEGDEDRMEWIVDHAMNDIAENVEFGEVTGSIDEGWYYNPPDDDEHQIEIRMFARIEDWRVDLGYRFADILEDVGFNVDVSERDGAGSIMQAFYGVPHVYDDLACHIYTGGWISTATVAWPHAAAAQMYAPYVGFMQTWNPPDNWNMNEEGYDNTIGPSEEVRDEFDLPAEASPGQETIEDMDNFAMAVEAAEFADEDEYWENVGDLGRMGTEEAVRIFLTTGIDFYPYDHDTIGAMVIESVNGYDTYFGPRTMQVEDGELGATLLTGIDRPFMDNWNLYGGSSDVYTIYPQRMMREKPNWAHPRTGRQQETVNYWSEGYVEEMINYVDDWEDEDDVPEEYKFEGEIDIGDDLQEPDIDIPEYAVDYDPVENEWVNANDLGRTEAYVSVTYDTFEEHTWHCGSDFSVKDIMAWYARSRRLAAEDNVDEDYQDIFHSTHQALTAVNYGELQALHFDEEAGTYTVWTNYNFPDDSQLGMYHSYSPETHPLTYDAWDHLHAGSPWQEAAGVTDTYSYDAGPHQWIHQVSPIQSMDNAAVLEVMLEEEYVPPYYTEGEVPIEVDEDEVLNEMENLIDFIYEYEHTYVGIGPFYMTEYDTDVQELHLERHEDYGWPFDQEWDPESPFEEGYWSAIFEIEEIDIIAIDAPDFWDIVEDEFEAVAEAQRSGLFPEIFAEEVLDEHLDEDDPYSFVLWDDDGNEVASLDHGDIDMTPLGGFTEFVADIPIEDLEAGYYELEFRIWPRGEPGWTVDTHEMVLYFDPNIDIHTFEVPDDVPIYDTAEMELELENFADEDDTAEVVLIDEDDEEEVLATQEVAAGETVEFDVDREFDDPDEIGDYTVELRDEAGNILAIEDMTVWGTNIEVIEFSPQFAGPTYEQSLYADEIYGQPPHDTGVTAEFGNPLGHVTLDVDAHPEANILLFNHGNQPGDATLTVDGEVIGTNELGAGSGSIAADWERADIGGPGALDYEFHPGTYEFELVTDHGYVEDGEAEDQDEYMEDVTIEEEDLTVEEVGVHSLFYDGELYDEFDVELEYEEEDSITWDFTDLERGLHNFEWREEMEPIGVEDIVFVSPLEAEDLYVGFGDMYDEVVEGSWLDVETTVTNHGDETERFRLEIRGRPVTEFVDIEPGETEVLEYQHQFTRTAEVEVVDGDRIQLASHTVTTYEADFEIVEDLEYERDGVDATLTAEVANHADHFGTVGFDLYWRADEEDDWEYHETFGVHGIDAGETVSIDQDYTYDYGGHFRIELLDQHVEDELEAELDWVEDLSVEETPPTITITAELEELVGQFDGFASLVVEDEAGNVILEETYTIPAGDSLEIEEETDELMAGDYHVELHDQDVDVSLETELEWVEDLAVDDTEAEVDITGEIENVGDYGADDIELQVEGDVIEEYELGPGEELEIDETYEFEEEGEYDITLTSEWIEDQTVTAVLEAEWEWIEDLDAELDADEVTITAEIENVGNVPGDLELLIEDEDEEEVASWDYTVDAGESEVVEETHTFEVAGIYTITLHDQEVQVELDEELEWVEDLAVDGEYDEITLEVDDEAEITAEIENVGDFASAVTLTVYDEEDEEVESWDYTIESGDTLEVEEDYTFDEEGDFTVALLDQEVDVTVEVAEYELEVTAEEGGEVTVEWNDHEETVEAEETETFYIEPETEVTLTAEADDGWEFHEWTGDIGDADEDDSEIEVTMDQHRSITAEFAEIEENYILEIDSTDGGEVIEPGEGTFSYEEPVEVDIEAEADDDYEFVEWTGDGAEYIEDTDEAETTFEFPDEEGTYEITAEFEEDEPVDMWWIIVIVVIVIIIIALVAMAMMKKPPTEEEEFEEEEEFFEEEPEEDLFEEEAEEEDLFEEEAEEEDLFEEEAEEEDLFEEEEPEEEL